jgi:D-3-phosphoglycerate dehydrogenase
MKDCNIGWASRAELIAYALLTALNQGQPGMAAPVDVFESEPILQGHALLKVENCICTPHG